jgi:hypothetical protein
VYSQSASYVGIYDDLDADDVKGGNVVLVIGHDGHNRLVSMSDFDDLYTFNVLFNSVTLRDISGSRAVDLMQVKWLGEAENAHPTSNDSLFISPGASALLLRDEQLMGMEGGTMGPRTADSVDACYLGPLFPTFAPYKERPSWGILYGIRAVDTSEERRTFADGSILLGATWNLLIENRVVGPQLGLVWGGSRGPFSLELQALGLVGYNAARVRLHGDVGTELVPGALNQPLYQSPTQFGAVERLHEISPAGELRAQSGVQVTDAVAIKVAWAALMFQNDVTSEDAIDYDLPGSNHRNLGEQQIFVQSFYCGVEAAY